MNNSVNDQTAAGQQQTDGRYSDPLFHDSLVNKKKISDSSCNILLSVVARNSGKAVGEEENPEAHILYDTPTCNQSYSPCELSSSDGNHTSTIITNADTAADNSQRIAPNSLNVGNVADDARYHILGQSQSSAISPNSETGTSRGRNSENIKSPQTPTDFLEQETAQVKTCKDNSTGVSQNDHTVELSTYPSSVRPPVTMKRRVRHSYKNRKLPKMTDVLSAIQAASKNIIARSGKLSTDMKEITPTAEKNRENGCCRKSGKVKRPASVTECRQNRCVRASVSGHPTEVSAGTEAKNSQKGAKSTEINRISGECRDFVKAEMPNEKHDNEKHDNAAGSGAKDLQLNLSNTPSTEKAPDTELNGDAAFELSVQSTLSETGLHGCVADAFNKRVKDQRSGSPFTGVSVKVDSDTHLNGSNAISPKHFPIKVDGFTQCCDEDCPTTRNEDTYALADAAKSTKEAPKYISCKYRSHKKDHVQSMSWPWPCCRKEFSRKKDLGNHFRSGVIGSKPNTGADLQGSKADPTLSESATLNIDNQINKHDRDKIVSCATCGKEFWASSQLHVHERTHWPVKPYACSICGKGFRQLNALKKHSREHTGETPFSCSHCGRAFCDLAALRKHQLSKVCNRKLQNLKEGTCDIEGFLVTYGVDGQVNTPVFFKCRLCKQHFQTWCQYTLHLQTHTRSPPHVCFACGQSYMNRSDVKVHCRVCCESSGEAALCGSSISEILPSAPEKCATVKAKQTDAHSSEAPESNSLDWGEGRSLRRFKCSRCGQRYKQYRSLCLHMRTHAPAFRYVCKHCGHFFRGWNKLWSHQRIHRQHHRCFTCSLCNLRFNIFSSYKMHLLNHAEGRPYTCPLCLQTFACKEGLSSHQCSFPQPKLQCDVCARSFSHFTNFIKHNLLHNGARSHQRSHRSWTNNKSPQEQRNTRNNTADLLPSVPSEPLTFLHKCNVCKSSFSNGDLLYAHQICHTRDLKSLVHPTKTLVGMKGLQSTTRRSLLSTLDLDAVPKSSLFKYPHPDKLYVPPRLPSMFKSVPVVNLASGDEDVPQESGTVPVSPNSVAETVQFPNSEEILLFHTDTVNDDFRDKASRNINRTTGFVETSVFLEGPTTTVNSAEHEVQDETFKCADCSENVASVQALYEHYFLHALGKKSL